MANKRGQPTKFSPTMQKIAAAAYKYGATDAQVAADLGVSERTLNRWRLKHPEYCRAVKDAKVIADEKVERSLYERACGSSIPEDKVFCSNGEVTIVPGRKHYPPETTACIFWLKNRRPDEWRDQRNLNIEILTDEERMDRIDILLQSVLDRDAADLIRH